MTQKELITTVRGILFTASRVLAEKDEKALHEVTVEFETMAKDLPEKLEQE